MATFAFIHGAGDVGWYWHLVEAELRTRGHATVAPDLPIEGDVAGLGEYAATVLDAIPDPRDLVVVARSFGGYVAPIVAERAGARLIVLVAAMIPSRGESEADQSDRRRARSILGARNEPSGEAERSVQDPDRSRCHSKAD